MENPNTTIIHDHTPASDLLESRNLYLFPAAFLGACASSLLGLGMIFYLETVFKASSSSIGFFNGLWSLTYIFGCLLFKPIFDRFRAATTIFLASALMAIFVVSMAFSKNLGLLFGLQALYGLSIALFWPPLMGWVSSGKEGKKLGNLMSYYNFSWSAGVVMGPYLAGYLFTMAPVLPIYTGAFLFSINACIFMIARLKNTDADYARLQNREKSSETMRKTLSRNHGTPLRYPSWLSILVSYLLMAVIVTVFPLYAKNHLSASEEKIGTLMFVRSLVFSVSFIVWAKTTFWHFSSKILIINQGILLILCLLMGVVVDSIYGITLMISVISIFIALSYSISQFHGVAGSSDRTFRMTIHEAMLSMGLFSGSYMGGWIYECFSFYVVFAVSASLIFCFLVAQTLLILMMGRRRKANDFC